MKEVKTALRRLALYIFLLAVNTVFCASVVPDRFPLRNLSTIYLLVLTVCLILYYSHRVPRTGALSAMMKLLAWMWFLLILLRGVKYSSFSEVEVLARHVWYLYYLPMLLMPLFLFGVSLLVAPKNNTRVSALWYGALAVSVCFIVLVLTNDLHEWVFRFQPGFAGWDGDYTRTWLFYAIYGWHYALYLISIIILIAKCRIGSSRKSAWIITIPFAIGGVLNLLLLTGNMPTIYGGHIVEFPEALIFMASAVLECCIQLGLIPTNTDYGKLFGAFSIAALITDRKGKPVYASRAALPLDAGQLALPDGARIGEHTALRKMEIPGGYGYWQVDMTELDRLNEELADAKEGLAQEGELIRLRSELKERKTKIEQRTLVYDTIARRTQRQSQLLSRLAKSARLSKDIAFKEECRGRIAVLGAYIKRYANLMLLSRESNTIEAGELGLSASEVLRYLNFRGIPGECFIDADNSLRADAALAVYEAFGILLEDGDGSLRGVFVNLSGGEKTTFKMTVENLAEPLPDGMLGRLSALGVRTDVRQEDMVTYLCFTLPKGGEAV